MSPGGGRASGPPPEMQARPSPPGHSRRAAGSPPGPLPHPPHPCSTSRLPQDSASCCRKRQRPTGSRLGKAPTDPGAPRLGPPWGPHCPGWADAPATRSPRSVSPGSQGPMPPAPSCPSPPGATPTLVPEGPWSLVSPRGGSGGWSGGSRVPGGVPPAASTEHPCVLCASMSRGCSVWTLLRWPLACCTRAGRRLDPCALRVPVSTMRVSHRLWGQNEDKRTWVTKWHPRGSLPVSHLWGRGVAAARGAGRRGSTSTRDPGDAGTSPGVTQATVRTSLGARGPRVWGLLPPHPRHRGPLPFWVRPLRSSLRGLPAAGLRSRHGPWTPPPTSSLPPPWARRVPLGFV